MSLTQQLCNEINCSGAYDLNKIASLLKQGANPNENIEREGAPMCLVFDFPRNKNWLAVIAILLEYGGDPFIKHPDSFGSHSGVDALLGNGEYEPPYNSKDERNFALRLICKKISHSLDKKYSMLKEIVRSFEGRGCTEETDYIDFMEELIVELISASYLDNERYNELLKIAHSNDETTYYKFQWLNKNAERFGFTPEPL
jgi:hypothetical protein